MSQFTKAGLIAIRSNRVLLFRKRKGTRKLILPGGKLDGDETAEEALLRELDEEMTGAAIGSLQFLGTYHHQSADADALMRIELFVADLHGEPVPSSEIEEIVWFDWNSGDWSDLAPSLRENVFPDLLNRGVLQAA